MSDRHARKRVGVLISGRGSNMVSLAEAAQTPGYPADIALVVSNIPDVAGLERARGFGIATATVDHRTFGKDREAFERAVDEVLRVNQIDLVVLAGFMRILTPWFVQRWEGRMINIHPSLLPLFKGTHTHAQALAAGVSEHGCSVHFVVPELDAGPVILQAKVPVLAGDDEETLSQRVLVEEHKLYPAALAEVASGRARLVGGVVERG
ncbi:MULTISPECIES: phosphoribosylglycinamide formyltransferase [unclassified Bosea (in: a-proteobacteria)]|uniref:phosphoribosylglycinamide formyltransferase n=1 Tax=unclassified Bosea (in: a-proteobacteria) TaxID=2653178 RepID=UPI000957374B|nr:MULTISPECIES: phosphoribosylglycinamide formyltransferase [unclassified Bosea (in: a-proteobacteria)]TAJ29270.1 MAG: phosphoribosylglycinamide formyltransferase [Bosea sp. (in: a-proteobacteria)]SIP90988.1 phosphoribosylglycinamide formyltransferase-1 [Bosea sp. TND4EK4]